MTDELKLSRDFFQHNPPTAWMNNPDDRAKYAQIYGPAALQTLDNTGKVEENYDPAFVRPGGKVLTQPEDVRLDHLPGPGDQPTPAELMAVLRQILACVQRTNPAVVPPAFGLMYFLTAAKILTDSGGVRHASILLHPDGAAYRSSVSASVIDVPDSTCHPEVLADGSVSVRVDAPTLPNKLTLRIHDAIANISQDFTISFP
jgi:hypothetical protein